MAQQMQLQSGLFQNRTSLTTNNSRLGSGNINTQSLIPIYDSIYNWKMDTSVMQWKYKSKYIDIIYDSQQNENGYLFQLWTGSNWENSVLDSEVFVIYNKRLSQLQKKWNGTSWFDSIQTTNNYDTSYKILTTTTKKWNGTTLANSSRDSFNYDSHNNQTHDFFQSWSGSAWTSSGSINNSYTYYSNGLINTVTSDYNSYPSSVSKTVYTYNLNNMVSHSSDYMNIAMCGLMNTSSTYYYYNSNNKLDHLSETLYNINQTGISCNYTFNNYLKEYWIYDGNGNVLTDSLYRDDYPTYSYLYKYTYDLNNNLLKKIYNKWNGTGYIRNYQDEYTYDSNNLKQTYTHKVYGTSGVNLLTGDSTVYYFIPNVGVKQFEEKTDKFVVYPNPSSSIITVEFESANKNNRIYITDIMGNELFNVSTKDNKEIIDISSLSSGLYFIKTCSGVQKFLKQ